MANANNLELPKGGGNYEFSGYNKMLRWGQLEPLYLLPYRPQINPIGECWLLIKTTRFYPTSISQITDQCQARHFPGKNRSLLFLLAHHGAVGEPPVTIL